MKTIPVAIVSALLFGGCVGPRPVVLDPSIPHQVAAPTTVMVWGTTPEGRKVQVKAHLMPGDWIASDAIVNPRE